MSRSNSHQGDNVALSRALPNHDDAAEERQGDRSGFGATLFAAAIILFGLSTAILLLFAG